MARITNVNLGVPASIAALCAALKRTLDPMVLLINDLSDGKAVAANSAATFAPGAASTTQYAVGDFIKNSAPAELGVAGSKYLITGWMCVTTGTPGVWKECRVLTGN
ncbi:conserved hypothetical protein [Paraburkholderia tropica]